MRVALKVGDVAAEPGQLAYGLLRIGDLADGCSPLHIPVIILNGIHDGPVVYLHAGSHGQEAVYAIEMMRRLARVDLDPTKLRGAIVMVPAANLLAYQAATRISPLYGVREGGPFGGDMHKLWPGDPLGSVTQRLASAIWGSIVSQADFVLDYHTNSVPGFPFALMYQPQARNGPEDEAWQRSLRVAEAFGMTVVVGAHTPNSLSGASMKAGKAAMAIEAPCPRVLDQPMVAAALRGTVNVLVHLGLIEGTLAPQYDIPVLPGEHHILPSIRANRGGVIHYRVEPGVLLQAGTVIASIYDVFGNPVETVRMAQDGYVSTFPPLSWSAAQTVASGEYVADCFD